MFTGEFEKVSVSVDWMRAYSLSGAAKRAKTMGADAPIMNRSIKQAKDLLKNKRAYERGNLTAKSARRAGNTERNKIIKQMEIERAKPRTDTRKANLAFLRSRRGVARDPFVHRTKLTKREAQGARIKAGPQQRKVVKRLLSEFPKDSPSLSRVPVAYREATKKGMEQRIRALSQNVKKGMWGGHRDIFKAKAKKFLGEL